MKKILNSMFVVLALFALNVNAQVINDTKALNGTKEIKGLFMIDFSDIKTTAFYLKILEDTKKDFTDAGVKSDLVFVFIGKTVTFLSSKQDEKFKKDNAVYLESIQNSIKKLSNLGVRLEVCDVATKAFGINNNTMPKQMHISKNGFVSVLGWQNQGYHFLPLY